MSFDSTLHAKAIDLTRLSYDMTAAAGSGHPTSAASLSHLVAVLMYNHMRHEPANPGHPSSDRLVLSEGHAVPILYAACADMGVHVGKDKDNMRALTREDVLTLREMDSLVDGHPNPVEGFPFFDAATGSLGQGLSVAAGLAIAARLDGLDKRIFCIIGDGESREGQIWEAIDFIMDEKLTSVLPIFNCNVFAQSNEASPQQSAETTAKKLEAAGMKALVIDGHSPSAIAAALKEHAETAGQPDAQQLAIVAKTVKGWGAPSQQGNGHHGQPAKGEALERVKEELAKTATSVGAIVDTPIKVPMLPSVKPQPAAVQRAKTFTQAMTEYGQAGALEQGKFAGRKAYGVAVRELGHAHSGVVCLDADVRGSTGAAEFYKDDAINDRFVDCRIAEQNMVSVAAGLSAGRKVPFCSTFGKFFTRAYDQIEMAINSGANLNLVGSHAGITLAADGPSQMAMPDVAWFASFATMQRPNGTPGCYVLQPSDAYSSYMLTLAMAEYDGSCYLRTLRGDTEILYSDGDTFKLGGHQVLVEGRDLLICASGYMVHEVNKALETLDAQGVDATVVDMYSIPFDADAILELANDNHGMILTVEDNYGQGLGAAIASVAAADGGGFTVEQMHVTRCPKSGKTPDELLAYCGLSSDDIAKRALSMLSLTSA